MAHRAQVDAVVADTTSQLPIADVEARLDAADIPSARVNTVMDFLNHPQLSERGRWREIDSPVGRLPSLLPATIFSGVELRMDAVPALGEHNEPILTELGYNEAQIAGLRGSGAI